MHASTPTPNRAERWFRRLLGLRLPLEAAWGAAWVLASPDLWSMLTQAHFPLRSAGIDPAEVMRAGGVLPLAAAGFALAVVLARRSPVGLSWTAVVLGWVSAIVRWWLLRSVGHGGVGLALHVVDLGWIAAVTVMLQVALPAPERLGVRSLWRTLLALAAVGAAGLRALRRPIVNVPLAAVVVVVAWLGYLAWAHLRRPAPEPVFGNDLDHFKYAPLGNGRSVGLPWYVWEVLPEVFADKLPRPGGYEGFGLLFEPGNALPVGAALRTNGVPMLSFNCALCHSGSYRTTADSAVRIVIGAPAVRLDFIALVRFLLACGADPRFTGEHLLPKIEARHPLSRTERMLYRHVIIPVTRMGLKAAAPRLAWTRLRPPGGAGRVDAINILNQVLLNQADDGSVGNTDILWLWNQRAAAGQQRGWNGGSSVHEGNLLAAALFLGFKPGMFAKPTFDRIERFLTTLNPPVFPGAIDADLAARGASVFKDQCAQCHGPDGARTGRLTPASEVGTDAHYLQVWRPEVVEWLRTVRRGAFAFPGVTVTDGFANHPLDGLWLRAPYLHNGSVPTLRDLLEPPERRPVTFLRGYDVYDPERVGFVSSGADAEREGFRVDTRLVGNANTGHPYGTELGEADKRALIEYLKTL